MIIVFVAIGAMLLSVLWRLRRVAVAAFLICLVAGAAGYCSIAQ
jgi:hypothetical protein